MSFLYPLGLLGLIGVPILIIIYIIKNKYTEQTVSSTYIWTLSEKFLKRKNPINKLAGIISLILQILIVVLLSFGIAHPVFTLPGMAERYTFVLDCSASMRIQQGNSTRFDQAKQRLTDVVNSSVGGSTYTFICAGDATTVYEQTTDKSRLLSMLDQAEAGYAPSDMEDAISSAQEIFTQYPSAKTYVFTDKSFENHENVEVVNVSDGEENYAVHDVTYTENAQSGTLEVKGFVTSYESDADLTVRVTLSDGRTTSSLESKTTATRMEDAPFAIQFECQSFDYFTVNIVEQDALDLDNTVTVYSVNAENTYSTLIVSGEGSQGGGFFMESLISSVSPGEAQITVMGEEEYRELYLPEGLTPSYPSGYGLYIFDCFNPEVLPRDGTVWLIGLDSSLPDASFSVQGEVSLDFGGALEYSTSTSTTVRELLDGLVREDIYISSYIKYSPYRTYTTLLSYRGNPVIFTTQTAYGNREVVFAFPMHESDAAVRADMIILVHNLLKYSFPAVVSQTLYTCGDTAAINVLPNSESLRVESPSGKATYLNISSSVAEMVLGEVGEYKIMITVAGTTTTYRIYSAFSTQESATTVTAEYFALSGQQSNEGYDGLYDDLLILIILLAVIFLADWVVYCYEQYQLR